MTCHVHVANAWQQLHSYLHSYADFVKHMVYQLASYSIAQNHSQLAMFNLVAQPERQ